MTCDAFKFVFLKNNFVFCGFHTSDTHTHTHTRGPVGGVSTAAPQVETFNLMLDCSEALRAMLLILHSTLRVDCKNTYEGETQARGDGRTGWAWLAWQREGKKAPLGAVCGCFEPWKLVWWPHWEDYWSDLRNLSSQMLKSCLQERLAPPSSPHAGVSQPLFV